MMTHLKKLCALDGVSGCEEPVRRYILAALKASPAEITAEVDPLGNIIARVKAAVSIPVIGNGDVTGPEAAERMLKETGCDAVLIGRAARGNPWIFRRTIHYLDTGELLPSPPIEEVREMMLRHAALLTEYKGEYTAIREMRKHVCWYTAGYPHSARLRERINEMETMQELEAVIRG